MSQLNKIKETAEKAAEYAVHPENETRREARKRQKLMPILGSLLAALVLLALFGTYFEWV